MRSIWMSFSAALIAMSCAWAAPAANPPAEGAASVARGPKIGYVDITRVWRDYHRRTDFDREFKTLRSNLNDQDRNRAAEIARYEKEIEQFAMGTPDRLALEEKRKTAMRETEEFRRKSHEELNQRFVAMLRQLFGDVEREVEAAAKEGNYDLVIKDQSQEPGVSNPGEAILQISQMVVLYAKPEYDLTDRVIQRLNDRHGAEQKKAESAPDPQKQPETPPKEK